MPGDFGIRWEKECDPSNRLWGSEVVFEPNPWRKLRKTAWYSLVAYLALAWVSVVVLLFSKGSDERWLRLVPASADGPMVFGSLHGQVRNVLGDPVPGAWVRVGEKSVQADEHGRYFFESVPIGQHTLELEAPGYQKHRLTIQVEVGENRPPITSDTGLWPETLAVSFHVFINFGRNGEPGLYGYFGIANGTGANLYIHSVLIQGPSGQPVFDLVQTDNARRAFLSPHEEIAVEKEGEHYYWVVPAQIVIEGELPVVPNPAAGLYRATVAYSAKKEVKPEEITTVVVADQADVDINWNPRVP